MRAARAPLAGDAVFVWLTRLFDLAFAPFATANPLYPILLFAILTGVLMVITFRYTSNQPAIKRVKHKLAAHILEVRLFQDQLGVVWRAYGRILRTIFSYVGLTLKPLAVMLIPLVLLIVQMDMRLGVAAMAPGADILIEARLNDANQIDEVTLAAPGGLAVTAPALRIASEREVDWRLRAERPGDYRVEVTVGGEKFEKQVLVSQKLAGVNVERARTSFFGPWLNPGEPSLPSDGPLESIRVDYPARDVSVAGWKMHWLIPFFVLALVASYAVKGFFRTEF